MGRGKRELTKLICIEGVDGSGKTTVARRLAKELNGAYYRTPPEPFRRIRSKVDGTADLATRFHFYLASVFAASQRIVSLLKESDVVCDRYIESTLIHHEALGLVIPSREIYYRHIVAPDYTVVLHAEESVLLKRLKRRKKGIATASLLELDRDYQQLVGDKFRKLHAIHIDTTDLRCEETVRLIVSKLEQVAPITSWRHVVGQ